jgi:hypothetical protein
MIEDALIEGFNAAYRALATRVATKILTFEPDPEHRFDLDAIVAQVLA